MKTTTKIAHYSRAGIYFFISLISLCFSTSLMAKPLECLTAKIVNIGADDYLILDNGQHFALAGIKIVIEGGALSDFLIGREVIVMCDKAEKTDRYNRIYGYLEDKNTNELLQKILLDEGFAYLFPYKGQYIYSLKNLYKAEAGAIAAHNGLWVIDDYALKNANNFYDKGYVGHYQIAVGEVKKVFLTEKLAYLNFGANHKTDFSVSLPLRMYNSLLKQSKLESLVNQKVMVRGIVEDFNGLLIKLDAREQLNIISER